MPSTIAKNDQKKAMTTISESNRVFWMTTYNKNNLIKHTKTKSKLTPR